VGGFGSGRRGGTATAESTASYIIDIKSLAPAFESGKRLTGPIRFDEGRFSSSGYPGNPKLPGNSGGYPVNQSADRCLAV
jgi:hypothetical protein